MYLGVRALKQVAKRELALECDYSYEARCQAQFRQLVAADPELRESVSVPDVVAELSTPRLLTTEWVPGAHIDKVRPQAPGLHLTSFQTHALAPCQLFPHNCLSQQGSPWRPHRQGASALPSSDLHIAFHADPAC